MIRFKFDGLGSTGFNVVIRIVGVHLDGDNPKRRHLETSYDLARLADFRKRTGGLFRL